MTAVAYARLELKWALQPNCVRAVQQMRADCKAYNGGLIIPLTVMFGKRVLKY